MTSCNKKFGKGLGGIQRQCRREVGHLGKCHDMPFLLALKGSKAHKKIAEKIERDSFNTRGASWGADQDGNQARKNRQPRWTVADGDSFYPAHHQTYDNCLIVASELTLQAYEMVGAPVCPPACAKFLPMTPKVASGLCPICNDVLDFSEFDLAVQSKAAIDTDHLNPGIERRHTPGNVAFVHHLCNTTKGDRSLEEFERWMIEVLKRKGLI